MHLAQSVDAAGSNRWTHVIHHFGGGIASLGAAMAKADLASLHPGVVATCGVTDMSDDYVVMPRLSGEAWIDSLRNAATGQPAASYASTAAWLGVLRSAAETLTSIHAAGWTHGQVAPHHLWLTPERDVRLTGTSRAARHMSVPKPRPISDAEFAAPEVVAGGHAVTTASDVYSLGKTLWWTLSQCETPSENGLPESIADLITQMIAPIDARPSMAQVTEQLVNFEARAFALAIRPPATILRAAA